MTLPSQEEATEQFARVYDEIQRLNQHFAQRPQAEKKRLGQLQKLLTKLRRLKNGNPLKSDGHEGERLEPISAAEQKLIASLAPPKKS